LAIAGFFYVHWNNHSRILLHFLGEEKRPFLEGGSSDLS